MMKDKRYSFARDYYATGKVPEFKDLFEYIPKTVVAEDIRTTVKRMTRLIEEPHTITAEEVYLMSELFEIPLEEFITFTLKTFISKRKASLAGSKKI